MPTLNWIGKEKVVSHHLEVPYRVLDRKYTFGDTPDSGNMIIHGDNLEALKALLPEYENRIKCIYIDPPYNTGASPENGGWIYYDNVNDPHIRKWLGKIVGAESDDLSRHDKWLCMMYPRLVLLQRLLSEDGVILISIDDNEQVNLKLICDEIFGPTNFIATFIWRGGRRNLAKYVSSSHEYMLCYCKNLHEIATKNISWKEQKKGLKAIYKKVDECIEKSNGNYELASKLLKQWYRTLSDDDDSKANEHYNCIDEKGVYFPSDISRGGGGGPKWKVINPNTGHVVQTPSRGWSYAKYEDLIADINAGVVHFNGDGVPCKKRYLKENEGQVLETVFYRDRRGSSKRLRVLMQGDVFPFPKDEEILSHFFQIFTDKNSIILDSFAGSGTTAHAVLNLNKQDGGHRKFILCEMCDYAENITAERVRRVMKGYGAGNNAVEGTGGSFDFYELGETIFDPATGNLNDEADTEQIRRYLWFSETNVPYPTTDGDAMNRISTHPYYLGTHQHNNYYFYYIKGEETCLDWDFLNTFTEQDRAEMYIIYADRCVLTEEEMLKLNIRFKKIPRDIKRV